MNVYYCLANQNEKNGLSKIIKDDVKLISLTESMEIPENALIVIDDQMSLKNNLDTMSKLRSKNVIVYSWNKIYEILSQICWQIYSNSEQYYLRYSIDDVKKFNIDTLILGSSYAKYGISSELLGERCVNWGLDAQDVYYSLHLGYMHIKENQNIRKIIIGTGYYWFHTDISKANTSYFRNLISNTYYPILKDLHNASDVDSPSDELKLQQLPHIFDASNVVKYFTKHLYLKSGKESAKFVRTYNLDEVKGFHTECHLSIYNMHYITKENELIWRELPPNIKELYAKERCVRHDKVIRHEESYEDNIRELDHFIDLCNRKGIEVYIVTMPHTKYYLDNLSSDFKVAYLAALNSIKGRFHYVDFNDVDVFTDEDFLDSDHLNALGARKVTEILKEIMGEKV